MLRVRQLDSGRTVSELAPVGSDEWFHVKLNVDYALSICSGLRTVIQAYTMRHVEATA